MSEPLSEAIIELKLTPTMVASTNANEVHFFIGYVIKAETGTNYASGCNVIRNE